MGTLIDFLFVEEPVLSFSLDTVVCFMVFVMILSTIELVACSLGKVRGR